MAQESVPTGYVREDPLLGSGEANLVYHASPYCCYMYKMAGGLASQNNARTAVGT